MRFQIFEIRGTHVAEKMMKNYAALFDFDVIPPALQNLSEEMWQSTSQARIYLCHLLCHLQPAIKLPSDLGRLLICIIQLKNKTNCTYVIT